LNLEGHILPEGKGELASSSACDAQA